MKIKSIAAICKKNKQVVLFNRYSDILQDYERGARDINGAKLATLLKICNALECSLRDILTDPATLEGLDEYDKRRS